VAFATVATPSLSRTAWLLTGSAAEADDLVQEALVRTYTSWHRVRRDDARAYARRVMVNRHVDRWRRARRELAALARGGGQQAETVAPHTVTDDRDELVRALQRLRPRERTMLVLRYYADLTEPQVARELGCSVGTVKSTSSRALARLRIMLGDGPVDADPLDDGPLADARPTAASSLTQALPKHRPATAIAGVAADSRRTS
jgi:RNA polymerase sigma-70 factor (sigma-E family)